MTPDVVVTDAGAPFDREVILRELIAYNEAAVGPSGARPLAVLLRDPATAETLGGLWGRTSFDWLYVELLVIPEALRGQGLGAAVLAQAETEARARGCAGIWLDTFDFQARGFYEKLGFEVFGSIPGHPRGRERFFLRKTF
ncbi:GNAT family N-acetyltransferase [Methylopila sp. Yamaguchi]|uniref:GNAT family N-acetyltransferase n=1 Tax=Methylopila sp. Yamaguchi TaxID=1437817 RepID=UPI000CAC0149|nr:GNAT family N-acetyltransferase [Methylopila sp. Yamaguchi]GBD48312.1 N-acetyltransferase GCN5 [Methylopila sp. Yamaguchi]